MNIGINSRENLLVWLFSFFIFLFVLVQFHVVLFDFAININLADFFVMLVLSTLLLGFFYTKTPVRWKVKNFNIFALLTCLALASGWLTALLSDYSISWATTKAIGWIVILGYLYASAMLVNRLGGFWRYSASQLFDCPFRQPQCIGFSDSCCFVVSVGVSAFVPEELKAESEVLVV